jgi:nuclear migration protein JNM1
MPQPLLPLLTRLSTQLTVLTQPRHLDNISRRLKLLLSDLDRLNTGGQQRSRQQTHHNDNSGGGSTTASAPSTIQDQLSPVLARLVPVLPHIPHILTRLRTLSTLHTSAAEFQRSLEGLEEDQRRLRDVLGDLDRAVDGVESSLKENAEVAKKNVTGLEERIQALTERLDKLNA